MKIARWRARSALVALVTVTALVASACYGTPPPPSTDSDNAEPSNPNNRYGWFEAGLEWRGDFGDPHVVRVGSTYYAYSSPVGGRYLPVLTSTDLVHWYIHRRWTSKPAPWAGGPNPQTDPEIPAEIRYAPLNDGDTWNMNDGLVRPASWGLTNDQGPWIKKDLWAPGVTQIGNSWYAYSSVRVSWTGDDPNNYGRFCLTVASAPSPLGPFRDVSGSGPILCDVDPSGSIDPSPFYDAATGTTYLLWKAAGRRTAPGVQGYPSALKSVALTTGGLPTGPVRTLLTTKEGSWEGMTIENPSMVAYGGRYYLFYSGNSWTAASDGSSPYATGWAECSSGPRGGCVRRTSGPLLRSSGHIQGPGGASAFIDTAGRLRLAYAYYWLGENRRDTFIAHPRRLKVATIVRGSDGVLRVG